MSAASGKDRHSLICRLAEAPESFELLQALRLLRAAQVDAELQRAAAPSVRIVANPSLGYVNAELGRPEAASGASADGPAEELSLRTNAIGLHGPSGVLPAFVTQAVASTGSAGRLGRTLDFFNHELTIGWGRVAEGRRADLLAERVAQQPASAAARREDLTGTLLALAGGVAGAAPSDGADAAVGGGARSRAEEIAVARFFAAAWRNRPVQLTALRAMLESLLQLPVQVLPFEPVWTEVEPNSRMRLGECGGRVLGRRTRASNWGVCVRIGPVDYRTFLRLLPGRRLPRRLSYLLENALGAWTDFVIQPVLKREQVPNWSLGREGKTDAGTPTRQPRLGRSLFLRGRSPTPFPGDFARLKITSSAIRRTRRTSSQGTGGPESVPMPQGSPRGPEVRR